MNTSRNFIEVACSWVVRLVFILTSLISTIIQAQGIDGNHPPQDTIKIQSGRKQVSADSTDHYLRIRKILIEGNKATRRTIIIRELRLREESVIREGDLAYVLKKDEQKLFNLHLFNTATIQPLRIENDTTSIDLIVKLEERWYTFPVPRFQLSDRNFNEWWETYNHDWSRVIYGIKLYQYNLWGLNHTLLLKAQFGFQKNFQLLYRIPYINKKQKQGLIFEYSHLEGNNIPDSTINHKLNYIKSDHTLRTTSGVAVSYTYRNNFYLQHSLKYEYLYSNIADTLLERNPNYLGQGRKHQQVDALTYEISSDHRDVAAYPLKGYELFFGIQQSGIGLRQDLRKTAANFKFSKFIELKRNFYFSNFSFLVWSTPDNLPYFNYTAMGYDKIFVRGYEIYVVEGPTFFLNKSTLKKKLFSKNWHLNDWPLKQFNYLPIAIYLKTYADWGYVSNYSAYENVSINSFLSDKLLYSGGFGIDIVTGYDLAIRFEYTFTSQNNGFFLHFKKEF